jgi:subtilisin family serine protease
MSAQKLFTLFTLVGLLVVAGGLHAPAARAQERGVPDQYIVVFQDTVADPSSKARGLARANGLTLKHTYEHALKGFAAVIPPARLDRIKADPDVAFVEQDTEVSIAAQTLPTGINRIDGELSSTVSGNGSGSVDVDVAVIDTGIDIDHPDLNVVGGRNCSRGRSYDDGNGHGTHVAGTIAAKDDGNGVVGVAPGARLWAVRVLDNSGSGTTSSVICGIDWVTANASTIEVANMSLGGSGSDSNCGGNDSYHNAICNSVNAGVTYVVAAGNSAADANGFRPATYAEVITVSALADFDGIGGGLGAATCRADEDDTFANFSNYGSDVDIIAPGVCILSTWKGGGYNTISGTSMASPHVAGAAALYKASNPGASPVQVQNALISAATFDWDNRDDRDSIKEPLLNVSGF